MKKRVLCIMLALLMVFPLVFASFAETDTQGETKSNDRTVLSETRDVESLVKETPTAKATPEALEPVETPEALEEPEIDELGVDEPIEEPEEADEPEEEIVELPEGEDPSGDIWGQIEALEDSVFSGKKSASTADDYASLIDDVEQMVFSQDGYVEGSLVRNGVELFWYDVDGVANMYTPGDRTQSYNAQLNASPQLPEIKDPQCIVNGTEIAKKEIYAGGGLWCEEERDNIEFTNIDVAVFIPEYGLDLDEEGKLTFGETLEPRDGNYTFTADQICQALRREGNSNYYIFTQEYCTIDRIARALKKCKVVFIWTHGRTDAMKSVNDPNGNVVVESDVDNAADSFITLVSKQGLDDDFKTQWSNIYTHGTYTNAFEGGKTDRYNKTKYYVNGYAIAEHMFKAPNNTAMDTDNFLWLGSCYSMATPGFSNALCNFNGVKVIFGYSDAVKMPYDAGFRNYFWVEMGKKENNNPTVKEIAELTWDTFKKRKPCTADDYPSEMHPYPCYPVFVCHQTGDQECPVDNYPGITTIHLGTYGMNERHLLTHSHWTLTEIIDPDPTSTPGGGNIPTGWSAQEPSPGPDGVYDIQSIDPNRWPNDDEYVRMYYRGDKVGDEMDYHIIWPDNESAEWGYNRDYIFLRYEWEVGPDGTPTDAYAVFSTNYEVDELYDKIDNGDGTDRYVVKEHDSKLYGDVYPEFDEEHHLCCKIKMDLSFDEVKGKWKAEIPGEYPYSPTYSNGSWDAYVQYFDYTTEAFKDTDAYKKAWVFDHWEFTWSSDKYDIMPETACAVYYNAWEINADPRRVPAAITRADDVIMGSYTYSCSYATVEANAPDGVARKTLVTRAMKGWNGYSKRSDEHHFWIYDGVVPDSWDYSQFDPATMEGYATVTVEYHCAHCEEEKSYPNIKAYVTEKKGNNYTFTAFVGQVCRGIGWSNDYGWTATWDASYPAGGIDNITRYESTTKTYEPPATPTPSPTPTPTPTPHEHTCTVVGWIWHKAGSWDEPDDNTRFCDLRAEAEFGCECGACFGEVEATIVLDPDKPAHTYKAYIEKDPDGNACYYEDEQCYPNIHDWIFDGFYNHNGDFEGLYENGTPWRGGKNAVPFYHCSSCNERPGEDWFYEQIMMSIWAGSPLVSVSAKNDGHPDKAPLWVASIGADDSLDGQDHHVYGVCGQSLEWVYADIEWDPSDPEKAYAVYRTRGRETVGLGQDDGGDCGTPFIEVASYEWKRSYETPIFKLYNAENQNYYYDYSCLEIKVPVKTEKTGSVMNADEYSATILEGQSPDGEKHESDHMYEHDHEWGEPTYVWTQNGNAWKCAATRVCTQDASHVETETVTATGRITTPATCTTKGKTTYTATFTNTAFATQTKTVQDVPALGHNWKTPTYTWADDNSTVTARRECKRDASHVETETVNTTSEITTPATCTTKGKTTYTATFTNTAFATQTKTVQDVPALGHDWMCGFEWSIKNGGNVSATAYFACMGSDCEEYREVEAEVTLESGYTYRATVTMDGKTYTETQTFEAKYFHNWVFAGFNWGIGRVEAIYYCQDEGCDEQGIETATRMHGSGEECHKYWGYISEEDSLDNIEHNGYDQGWTVVFDFDHEWDVEKNHIHWEWDYNNGNPTAKATFDCMGCEAQKEIDAESVVRVTGMVSNTYKATVTLDGETYTSTKTFIPTVPGRPWIRKDDGIISPPTPRFRDDDIIKPVIPIDPISPVFPN